MNCYLIMVEGFACLSDPRGYVVGGRMPLVGFPKGNLSLVVMPGYQSMDATLLYESSFTDRVRSSVWGRLREELLLLHINDASHPDSGGFWSLKDGSSLSTYMIKLDILFIRKFRQKYE